MSDFARLAAIASSAEDAIVSQTLDGLIDTWNRGAERLFGWRAEEVIGLRVAELIPEDRRAEFAAAMRRLESIGQAVRLETSGRCKDGSTIEVSVTASPVRDDAGRVTGYSGVAREISRRTPAEEALRRSEDKYRAVVENIQDVIAVFDSDCRCVHINKAASNFLPLRPEEFVGKTLAELGFPADHVREWERTIRDVFATGESKELELCLDESDGTRDGTRYFNWRLFPDRDDAGRVRHVITASLDITDRKAAEDAVRASERRLRAIVEKSFDGIVLADKAGRVLYASPTSALILGCDARELIGRDWFALQHPDERPGIPSLWADLLRTPGSVLSVNHRAAPGAGRWRWLESRCTNLLDDAAVRAVVINFRDVTDRIEAEADQRRMTEELARTSHLLQAVADNVPDAMFVKDRAGTYLMFNEAAARFVGKQVAEVLGRDDTALFDPDSARRVMDRDRRVMTSGEASTADEVLTAAGATRVFQATKVPYRDAAGTVIGLIGISRDMTAQRRAEEALQLRDRAIRAVSQGILITDASQPDNPVVYVSPGFERLTGYDAREVLGRNAGFLKGPDTDPEAVGRLRDAIRTGAICTVELLNYRKDGTTFWNELSISPVRDGDGRLTHFVGVQQDVTARRRLEEQFRQAQKMEAIGQLAGGVAHDFNNLLTIINGYSDLLLKSLPSEDPSRPLLDEIRRAGERSAGLTRQLLAFSRKQVLAPRVLDLNAVVADAEKMLRRVIGEDVALTTSLAPGLGRTRADAGQVEQVLLNLAVNARDAMPTGGRLLIETRNVVVDDEFARAHPGPRPGDYVLLTVSDTGVGMPPDVKARIFEPFFTTKGPGKGTGLGLATVWGIVNQSGGHVEAYSEVGVGTTFKVYLRRAGASAPPGKSHPGSSGRADGTETILLVEDEDNVRALACLVLRGLGYTVLEARSGADALLAAREHRGTIHLLASDVIMPNMSGPQLARHLAAERPDTKVLFMSGYTDDAIIHHGIIDGSVPFLEKPYAPGKLARAVREILDRRNDVHP